MRDSKLKRKLLAIYERLYTLSHDLSRWVVLRIRYRLRIMSTVKTLKYIKRTGCSVARFGDGELSFALNTPHAIAFQNNSERLSTELQQVLSNNHTDLLLCIPRYLNSLYGSTPTCRNYWWAWGKNANKHEQTVSHIRKTSGNRYLFGDSLITRPYMDTLNRKYAAKVFGLLKDLWQDRNLLIVEGSQTRLGVGNDLFSNASSIRRIIAPAIGAFNCYDSIKDAIYKHHSDELVLLALGPTATVLASDLSSSNIQAIDIGHIDIEYEWFLQGASKKVAVSGKFVNEIKDGRNFSECLDPVYLSQIIHQVNPNQ